LVFLGLGRLARELGRFAVSLGLGELQKRESQDGGKTKSEICFHGSI
jgi:hypothetical protein